MPPCALQRSIPFPAGPYTLLDGQMKRLGLPGDRSADRAFAVMKHGRDDQVFFVGEVADQQPQQASRLFRIDVGRASNRVAVASKGREEAIRRLG